MDIVAKRTSTGGTSPQYVDKTGVLAALSIAVFGLRGWAFGFFLTPSMRVLLGLEQADTFAAPSSQTIALEDPGLLIFSILLGSMALLNYKVGRKAAEH